MKIRATTPEPDPVELSELQRSRSSYRRGRLDRSHFEVWFELQAPDHRAFLTGSSGAVTGTISSMEISPSPVTVVEGNLQAFVADPTRAETFLMVYELSLETLQRKKSSCSAGTEIHPQRSRFRLLAGYDHNPFRRLPRH